MVSFPAVVLTEMKATATLPLAGLALPCGRPDGLAAAIGAGRNRRRDKSGAAQTIALLSDRPPLIGSGISIKNDVFFIFVVFHLPRQRTMDCRR
jgi:hypothetical protein